MKYNLKRIAPLIFLFFFLHIGLSAQENYEQKLIDLLTSGRFFEAKELYEQAEKKGIFDSFFRLYYKYETAMMLNHTDSAAVFLEQLLEDGDEYWREYKIQFYAELLNLYENLLQDYPKSLFTCDRMLQYLEENPFGVDEDSIRGDSMNVQNKKKLILKKEKYPTIKFSYKGTNNTVKIKEDSVFLCHLFFDATYNNKTMTTLFDTGSSFYSIMNKEMADSIGVKRINVFENDTLRELREINGATLPMEEGILDSVAIANVKLYNIPVCIYKFDPTSNVPDSVRNRDAKTQEQMTYFSESTSLVMGYPVMFLLGKIIIDFENKTLSLPDDNYALDNSHKEPNFFVYGNGLYTRLAVNDIPLTVHADFGSGWYMQIHSSFYEKNRDRIPVKVLGEKKFFHAAMLHKTWLDIPYEIPENPVLKFNDRIICPSPNEDDLIQIYSLPDQHLPGTFDGHIGYPFFKNLGKKILFDFNNMRIEVVE